MSINLDFFTPKETDGAVKLTVHRTGKLGFSKNAIEILNIQNNKFCKFGKNSGDENDEDIYMVVSEIGDQYSFNISKAGDYYYIKAKTFLSEMNIDYTNEEITTIFDIQEIPNNNTKIYRLKKRELKKRK